MLEKNRQIIQNLSGGEIWMFIIARVLLGFSLGVFGMLLYPSVTVHFAWPALVIGVIFFILAAKGMFRRRSEKPSA